MLAEKLGLEAILGAFIAGAVLKLVDRDQAMTHFVVAGEIGMELGLISRATGAALIAAGLLSVLLFPLAALVLLRGREAHPAPSPRRSASQPA